MAGFIVKNDDTADHEVLTYGFGLILSGLVTYTVVLTSALLLGLMQEMLVAIFAYIAMRQAIGGVHANSRLVCFITYISTLYLCIFLSFILNVDIFAVVILYVISLILLILYAPADTKAQPMVKYRLLRKVAGIAILTVLFCISTFLLQNQVYANILLFVSTLMCVLLHPVVYRAYGCETSILKNKMGGQKS